MSEQERTQQQTKQHQEQTERQLAGYRLSPQQRHVWQRQQLDGATAYRAQCLVEITGNVESRSLRAALKNVIERQEILRTAFQRRVGMRLGNRATS